MIALSVQLLVLMLVFTLVEGNWPSAPALKWWRRPLLVDLCSWAVHPLALAAGLALAATTTGWLLFEIPATGMGLKFFHARGHLAALPAFAQVLIAIVATDFFSYWIHRAYHQFDWLWPFHIVHHTSEVVDWLSTARLHPLSQTVDTAVMGMILLLAGLSGGAVFSASLFIGAAALLAHANVPWTFGPFRKIFVSPQFHQWHHARTVGDAHEHIGNYGAVFSIWDWLFGTWTLPSLQRPSAFGVESAPPATLAGLGLHPLRVGWRYLARLNRSRR